LTEELGAAVLAIHHQRKNQGSKGRAGDNLRGHSSIEAAIDLALHVEREEGGDIITLKSTKTRGKDVFPFSAAFTYSDNENDELETAIFYGIQAEDEMSNVAIQNAITKSLTGLVMNKTTLTQNVKALLPKIGINRIRDQIDQLANTKKLKKTKGQKPSEELYNL
jgi:hypothetical protein